MNQQQNAPKKAAVKRKQAQPKEKQQDHKNPAQTPTPSTKCCKAESIGCFCGVFSPRTIFFTCVALLLCALLWTTRYEGPCTNILESTPNNLVHAFCPSKFPKSNWDKSFNFFAEDTSSRIFGAVAAAAWFLSLIIGVLLPTKTSLFAALLDFVVGAVAFGSSISFVVAFSRIVRLYDSFPCSTIISDAFKIIFDQKVCIENYRYFFGLFDFEKVKNILLTNPLYLKYFSTNTVEFTMIASKIIGEAKDYIPYILIAVGALILIKQTQKLVFKFAFVGSFVASTVLTGLFVMNNKEILPQEFAVKAIILFLGLSVMGLLAIPFFTFAFSIISVWGLFVGALLIPLKFTFVFPDSGWVYPILIGSICLKWIIAEPSNLLIFGGSYLLWQGVALLLRRQFSLEWLFFVFAIATIYYNVFEQRKAARNNLKLKHTREKMTKDAKAKKDN